MRRGSLELQLGLIMSIPWEKRRGGDDTGQTC